MLSLIGQVRHQPHAQPVVGHVADPSIYAWRGEQLVRSLAQMSTCPLVARTQAGDHLGQLSLPVAGDAGDAQDFACAHRERDALEGGQPLVVPCANVRHFQYRLADARLALLAWKSTSRPTISRASSAGVRLRPS